MSKRSPTLHVLHVVDALAVGGAERMLVEIANRTVVDGQRASVCVTRSGVALASRLHPAIEVLVLGRQRRFELRPLARLVRWCAANGVDVIHCHGRSSFSLIAMLAAARQTKAPVILHDHLGVEIHPEVPRWFRLARRYLAAYVAVYDEQVAWARRAGVPAEISHVIPNAIDMQASTQQEVTGAPLARRHGHAQLVVVGGLRREKATDVLLEAIALVRASVMLHVIGGDADPTYAARCRERARRADLAERVVFEGQRDDALALASTADLAVHSSRSESGPLVLAEYAARGLPFVSTRVGGVAVALAKAGAGRFVPSDDARALAQSIDDMLVLPATDRRQLGQTWREIASGLLDLSVVMPAWHRLYERLAGQPR